MKITYLLPLFLSGSIIMSAMDDDTKIVSIPKEVTVEDQAICKPTSSLQSSNLEKKLIKLLQKIRPFVIKHAFILDSVNDDIIKTIVCLAWFEWFRGMNHEIQGPFWSTYKLVLHFASSITFLIGTAHALRFTSYMTEEIAQRTATLRKKNT